MRQKDLAAGLGKTPGFISKLRSGKERWPQGLYQKAVEKVRAQAEQFSGP